MSKPSIVFVINSLAGGGAERVLMRLLEHSRDRLATYDFCLVLLDEEPEAYTAPDWLTVHRLGGKQGTVSAIVGLHALLRKLKPDLVVSFLTRANIVAVTTSKLLGHRVIISERANTSAQHDTSPNGWISKILIGLLYPRAHRVIAVSQGIADDLANNFGVRRDRIVTIANPVDGDLVRASGAEPPAWTAPRPYVVGMGRFVKTKNFALLIEAFAAARLEGHDLVLMGQGPLEADLRAEAAARGIADRVHMPGFLANPFPIIRGADLYVLPSNGEGFPNGLVEAMSLGVPVVSTDCQSGPAEILDERAEQTIDAVHRGRYGYLVPPNDAAAMMEAILAATDPASRDELGAAALAGAARYTVQTAVDRYWAEIATALSERAAR